MAHTQAHVGARLIPTVARGARSTGCECHTESNEVIGLVINQLGPVIDINKGGDTFLVYLLAGLIRRSVYHGLRDLNYTQSSLSVQAKCKAVVLLDDVLCPNMNFEPRLNVSFAFFLTRSVRETIWL